MSRQQLSCYLQEMVMIVQNMYVYQKRKILKNVIGHLIHGEGEVLTNDAQKVKYFNGLWIFIRLYNYKPPFAISKIDEKKRKSFYLEQRKKKREYLNKTDVFNSFGSDDVQMKSLKVNIYF